MVTIIDNSLQYFDYWRSKDDRPIILSRKMDTFLIDRCSVPLLPDIRENTCLLKNASEIQIWCTGPQQLANH